MKKVNTVILVGAIFVAIILGSVLYVSTKQSHPVEFFKGSTNPNYETSGDFAQVEQSPAGAWDETPGIYKILGTVSLLGFAYIIYKMSKGFTLNEKGNGKTWLYFLIPLVATIVFFFAPYSQRLAGNYKSVDRAQFDLWEKDGIIKPLSPDTYKGEALDQLFNQ